MIPAPFPVVLDANVLAPMNLRDLLLECASNDLYLPCWQQDILDEVQRTLVQKL